MSGPAVRKIGAEERRTRLARRHRVAPGLRAATVEEATAAMVCLHATDPATTFLSAWARVDGLRIEGVERALYTDRTLVKHLAMRRTLFIIDRVLLGAVQSGASQRVADSERRRLIRDVEKAGLFDDGDRWLTEASAAVVKALADGREATSTELRSEIALLEGSIMYGEGKSWGGQNPIGPRVLTVLSAAGEIVRATNRGDWTSSRPHWASMESWLGEPLELPREAEARALLLEQWLRTFGPGTEADIKWWLGSTLTAVRQALVDVNAVEVDLDGQVGYLMPDDLDPPEKTEPWVALLPALDPTTMGWFERDWYLGDYRRDLFDTAGNAGPTCWQDGRIVGGWHQSDHGEVILDLLEDIGRDARTALESEAGRLTGWVDGRRVLPRFPSPLQVRARSAS